MINPRGSKGEEPKLTPSPHFGARRALAYTRRAGRRPQRTASSRRNYRAPDQHKVAVFIAPFYRRTAVHRAQNMSILSLKRSTAAAGSPIHDTTAGPSRGRALCSSALRAKLSVVLADQLLDANVAGP